METKDRLLSALVLGPDDPAITVFLTHFWPLNQHYPLYQAADLLREISHGIRIVARDHRGHRAPGAGHMLPLERDQVFSGVLTRLSRTHL